MPAKTAVITVPGTFIGCTFIGCTFIGILIIFGSGCSSEKEAPPKNKTPAAEAEAPPPEAPAVPEASEVPAVGLAMIVAGALG